MKHAQITAAQTADLSPLQTAHAILFNGAAATLGGRLSADDEKTWIDAAQYALDTGDFGEIEDMLAEFDKWEGYHAYAYEAHFRTDPMDFQEWDARS
jgi:hypothetical protein